MKLTLEGKNNFWREENDKNKNQSFMTIKSILSIFLIMYGIFFWQCFIVRFWFHSLKNLEYYLNTTRGKIIIMQMIHPILKLMVWSFDTKKHYNTFLNQKSSNRKIQLIIPMHTDLTFIEQITRDSSHGI
jgi:hypothetical protein